MFSTVKLVNTVNFSTASQNILHSYPINKYLEKLFDFVILINLLHNITEYFTTIRSSTLIGCCLVTLVSII